MATATATAALAISTEVKAIYKAAKTRKDALQGLLPLAEDIDRIVKEYKLDPPRVSGWSATAYFLLTTTAMSFKDAAPAIEAIEALGLECKNTTDSSWDVERRYDFGKVALTVRIQEDSPNCVRRIVGYTQPEAPSPIYTFDCLEKDPHAKLEAKR